VQDDTHAFIVRVWHEPEDEDSHSGSWRGSIIHVGSESRQHFQNLDGIVRFIEERLGVSGRRRRLTMRSLLGRLGND
jgi:hypothetical protein